MYQKQLSYRLYLFFTFSLFVIFIITLFFLLSYYRNVQSVYSSRQQELKVYADSVSDSVAHEMDILSTISMNIVFSNAIRNSFSKFLKVVDAPQQDENKLVSAREEAWNLSDYIFITFGAFQRVNQVNLYSLNGYLAGIGNGVKTGKVSLDTLSWYSETMKRAGKKYISPPVVGYNKDDYEISLIRLFYDTFSLPQGIVEVVQDYKKLFKVPEEMVVNNSYLRIYIYNDKGFCLYPVNSPFPCVQNLPNNGDFFVEKRKLEEYDIAIYIFEDKRVSEQTIADVKFYYFLLILTVLTDTTIICFFISNKLTTSINTLSDSIGKIELKNIVAGRTENLPTSENSSIRIREIASLWQTFRIMQEKLSLSTKELLLSKSEEAKTKLKLVQSFVEPHFLYNILNTISVMAEDGMNEQIVEICSLLTSYLRYVSRVDDSLVTMGQELEMTKNYLDIMKIRFGNENFSYDIQCNESFLNIPIPRFIIQPLTENIFKFAFTGNPPWKITISVESDGSRWFLHVTDNGGTFDSVKKQAILSEFESLCIDDELKNLQIGGLGLKNTYIRLKMKYKEQAVFTIDNSLSGCTTVTIGGLLN